MQTLVTEITLLFRLRSLPVEIPQMRWQSRAAIECNKEKRKVCKTNFTQSIQFPLFLYILSKPKTF